MPKKIKKRKIKSKVKTKQKQRQRQSVIVKIDQSRRVVQRREKKDRGGGGSEPPPPPQRPITARPQQIYYDVNRPPPQAPRGGAVGGFIPPQFIYNQGAGNLGDNDRRGQDPRNDRRRRRDDDNANVRNEEVRKRNLRGRVVSGLRNTIRGAKQQSDINRLATEAKQADQTIGSLSGKVEQQAGDLRLQQVKYDRDMDTTGDIIDELDSAVNSREQDIADGLQKETALYSKIIDAEDEAQLERNVKNIAMDRADQAQKTADDFEEAYVMENRESRRQTAKADDAIKEVADTKRYGVAQTTAERAINTGMINVINKRSADKVNLAQAETNRAESKTSRVRAERNTSQNLEGARKERTRALDNLTKVQKQIKVRPVAVAGRLLGNMTNDRIDVYTEPMLYGARLRVYEAGRRLATLTGTSEGISSRERPVLFSNLTATQQANTGIKGSSGGGSISGGGGGLGRGGKAL